MFLNFTLSQLNRSAKCITFNNIQILYAVQNKLCEFYHHPQSLLCFSTDWFLFTKISYFSFEGKNWPMPQTASSIQVIQKYPWLAYIVAPFILCESHASPPIIAIRTKEPTN